DDLAPYFVPNFGAQELFELACVLVGRRYAIRHGGQLTCGVDRVEKPNAECATNQAIHGSGLALALHSRALGAQDVPHSRLHEDGINGSPSDPSPRNA